MYSHFFEPEIEFQRGESARSLGQVVDCLVPRRVVWGLGGLGASLFAATLALKLLTGTEMTITQPRVAAAALGVQLGIDPAKEPDELFAEPRDLSVGAEALLHLQALNSIDDLL